MGIAFVLGMAALPACLLELDHEVSCGDEFVDVLAGENCEPSQPESYIHACEDTERDGGVAGCDPDTCTRITTQEQCHTCGDDVIDTQFGEECEGSDLNGQSCQTGGVLRCSSECKIDTTGCPCGDGVLSDYEECDPSFDSSFAATKQDPRACSDFGFASGTYWICGNDCRYVLDECNDCGDGRLDGDRVVKGRLIPAEFCDGAEFNVRRFNSEYPMLSCAVGRRSMIQCNDSCENYEGVPGDCCLPRNSPCPDNEADAAVRCCSSIEQEGEQPSCMPSATGSVCT